MALWYLSYVVGKGFAGAVICEGGDVDDDDGLIAAARRAYDLGLAPNADYELAGKLVPPEWVERFEPIRDRRLSLEDLQAAIPEGDWKRLGNVRRHQS
jgi:hypothetical protein